jgi:phosphopantothenoylcysteine decarboxylase/phosphopantothenate--cysteine ligase
MKLLITAGPTREYLDDVRFLTNASSGRMGYSLAQAAAQNSWTVTLVSGPVLLAPPNQVLVVHVTSAMEMLEACLSIFPEVDGVIAAAAVADFRPKFRFPGKLRRTSESLLVELVPNPDILAELTQRRRHQWLVGFALEPRLDQLDAAREKLRTKGCDALLINSTASMESDCTELYAMDRTGTICQHWQGTKESVAVEVIRWIREQFANRSDRNTGS